MQTEAPRTLLVLKPGSFGDILHTLPAVARLRAAWPGCRITWLVNTEWMPLLAGNPDVDELIEFPRRGFRGWGGGVKALQWLRRSIAGRRPDLALDFQGLLRSALIGRVSGPRMLVGLSDAREGARWFYHRTTASPPQPVHAVERYLALADSVLFGAKASVRIGADPTIPFKLPVGSSPGDMAGTSGDFILFHPYARGTNKSLVSRDMLSLLRLISSAKIVVVGTGEPLDVSGFPQCLSLINRTSLAELIWLTRRASFVISVDSGPAHLAAALGKPMVAIHSWSDPRKVGPYHPDAWVWKNSAMIQMRRLASMNAGFFESKPLHLREADLEAIARLATSPSDFSA